MSVTIIDPPDNDQFPYDEGWTATATIDSQDAVDGILLDVNTNNIYPSSGPPPGVYDPGTGLYVWQIPFTHDANIALGDVLMINCYDAETFDPGDTHTDTASEAGLTAEVVSVSKGKKPKPGVRPTIEITDASLSGTTVSVTVTLTPKTTGALLLALLNYTGDIKKAAHSLRSFPLLPSTGKTRKHKFEGIDAGKWTHLCVIAVIYKHQGDPKAKVIRIPARKGKQGAQSGRQSGRKARQTARIPAKG